MAGWRPTVARTPDDGTPMGQAAALSEHPMGARNQSLVRQSFGRRPVPTRMMSQSGGQCQVQGRTPHSCFRKHVVGHVRERDAERVLNDLGGAVTVLAVVFFFEKLGHLYAH